MLNLRLIPVLALAVLVMGCDALFDDSETVWDGRVVEFQPTSASVTFEAGSDATATHAATVQFVAAQEANDNTITFMVDEEATSAEAGVHYELVNDGSVTLPSNSSATDIEINILGGNLDDGESVQLVLELTDDGDVSPSENYKRYTLSIAKEEPEDDE